MPIVVQKYGGTSVGSAGADPGGRRPRRARPRGRQRRGRGGLRHGRHHRRPHAPWRTTIAPSPTRASSTCCSRPANGSPCRCSPSPSTTAGTGPPLHGFAGGDHHRHPARQAPRSSTIRPGRILRGPRGAARRRSWPGSRGSRRRLRDHDARPRGGSTRRRSRWRRALGAERLRDLHRRRRRVHGGPARGARARASSHAISFEEMLELAAAGAKVLQSRSVEYARRHGVQLHVRSSFSDEHRARG